jgi:hypothetical protein
MLTQPDELITKDKLLEAYEELKFLSGNNDDLSTCPSDDCYTDSSDDCCTDSSDERSSNDLFNDLPSDDRTDKTSSEVTLGKTSSEVTFGKKTKNRNKKGKNSKLYSNCKLYTMDDQFIGYLSEKRLKWYLSKGIANMVDGDPTKIMINFIPSQSKTHEIGSNIEMPKENKCVVCGSDVMQDLAKFHVIPKEFKKYFKLDDKSHVSDEIVLLCKRDASHADLDNARYKRELGKKYSIDPNMFVDKNIAELKKLSKSIAQSVADGTIPSQYVVRRFNELTDGTNTTQSVDMQLVERYVNCSQNVVYDGCVDAAQYIVRQKYSEGMIRSFVNEWKNNFLMNQRPAHLPEDFFIGLNRAM